MTTPDERTRALLLAGELLTQLASSIRTPNVEDAIRKQAQHILRHYPSGSDIQFLAEQAERGAFVAGPMLDAALVHTNNGMQSSDFGENWRKTLLEKLAENGERILIIVGIGFLFAAAGVIVSLMCKFGSCYCN